VEAVEVATTARTLTPEAMRMGMRRRRMSSGTRKIPPPSPSSEPRRPESRVMRSEDTTRWKTAKAALNYDNTNP